MNNLKGSLLLTVTALIWGLAFVAQSSSMDYIGPYFFNLARSILAIVALSPLLIKSFKNNSKETIKKSIKAGLICGIPMALGTTFQQLGLTETAAGKASFITALYIVIVPAFHLLTGKKISWNVKLAVVLAVIGFYFLCLSESLTLNLYDFFVVLCAFCYALQIIFIDNFGKDSDSLILSCAQFFCVIVISLVLMVVTKEKVEFELVKQCAVSIIYAGVLSSGVGYTLQIVAQKITDPTIASLIMSLESVFGAISGYLILHNRFTIREVLGCILIFAGVILSEIPVKEK